MVMEAPPSPDSVGREFVRQYYTLLNKAPTHLHRFYNNQSSFVHGGLDPPHRETSPMVGQKQIHQKIQQLNFQDCHAKIAQVDAQATLGNGVVVQVTGELSNAGQPMRRFTQTFVLAAQSPKKYYVHNDIFRYQDEIISDEECENEARSDVEDEINQERPALNEMPPLNQQPIPYYNQAPPMAGNIAPVPHHHAQPAPHVIPPQPMPTVNGAVHPEELNVMTAAIPSHVATVQTQNINAAPIAGLQPTITQPQPPQVQPQQQQQQVAPVLSPVAPVEEIPPQMEEVGAGDGVDSYIEPMPQENEPLDISSEPISNEPKTYATLLKSGGSMGYASVTQMNSAPLTAPPKSISPPLQNRYDNRDPPLGSTNQQRNRSDNNMRNNSVRPSQPPQGGRMPRQDPRSGPPRNSLNEDGGGFEERRRSQGNFGDSNQLFLGNLPHRATEDDLREIFNQFGTIVDLRIHSKPNTKGGPPGARAPANYGFITYESQVGVQNCLAAKPIFYPANDKNGVTLNVEEKKTKERTPYGGGGRIGMDNNMGQRPRDSNGPRRGPSAPGGQPRQPGTGGPMGGAGGPGGPPGNRPNNFNRGGPPNRGPNTTYNNRR